MYFAFVSFVVSMTSVTTQDNFFSCYWFIKPHELGVSGKAGVN